MLISGRQSCEILATAGMTTRAARRVLASGLVGVPTPTRGAHLFDEERVRAIAQRPTLSWRLVHETCPTGIFIARRALDVGKPRDQQLETLADGWGGVSQWRWSEMATQIHHYGSLPFVAIVSSFVVLGADIVGVRGGSQLLFDRPGAWFPTFDGQRLLIGAGRPWQLSIGPLAVTTPTPARADKHVTDQ